MDTRTPPTSPWRPGRRGPTGDRILQKEIRWRPPKCDSRLPAPPVQIGDALAPREAQPDSPSTPGARTGRPRAIGFWGGVVSSDHRDESWPLRTPSAFMALGWAPCAGVRLPMHMNLPGNPNRPSTAPRAHSPCKIALYSKDECRSGPREVLGGIYPRRGWRARLAAMGRHW